MELPARVAIDVEKVRRRRSVWIIGVGEAAGPVQGVHNIAGPASSGIFYCESPRQLVNHANGAAQLKAIICPTPSPFSHTANLIRSLVSQRGILAVLGLVIRPEVVDSGIHVTISSYLSKITTGGVAVDVSSGVEGSDEAFAIALKQPAACYRPYYLYDSWLGSMIGHGLEAGVGVLLMGGNAVTQRDSAGRVWLINGPSPKDIALWIQHNFSTYVLLLQDMVSALTTLAFKSWDASTLLTDPVFLQAFATNARVAPFIGFPLFSVTEHAALVYGRRAVDERVTRASAILPTMERHAGTVSTATMRKVGNYLRNISSTHSAERELEITAATVLLSDVRRLVIDQLRREQTEFARETRHRTAAGTDV